MKIGLNTGVNVNPSSLTVGQLAEATGTSKRSIRHYDDCGLLPSRRSANGYRIFDDDAVETVAKIRALLNAGYNLDLIAQLLPCTTAPDQIDLCPTVAEQMRAVLCAKQEEESRLHQQTQLIESHLNPPKV